MNLKFHKSVIFNGERLQNPSPFFIHRYKTQTITIPQSPDGASSLCSKEPFN